MPLYSYDAAYPPTLAQLAAGTPTAVAVYLTGNFAVSPGWVAQLLSKGWGVVANYEQAAGELVTAGVAGGQAVGARALAAALNDKAISGQCGCKTGACQSAIYFSVDVDVPVSQFEAVGQAFDGINQALGAKACAHAYCEGALGEYLVNTKRICSYWLSASQGFPGWNPTSPNVAMWQELSSPVPSTDQNTITNPARLHCLWPAGSPYGGEIVTPEDIKAVAAAVWNAPLTDPNANQPHPAHQWVTDSNVRIAGAGGYAKSSVQAQIAALSGQVAGLLAAIKQLTGGGSVDLSAVQAAAKAGADEALSQIQVTVTKGTTTA